MIRMREQEYSEGMFHRFSVHHIKGCVMSVCLAAGDVNFNRLIKWFSGLLHCKMTVSPLLTNKLFKEDTGSSNLRDNPDGWEGVGSGREVQEGGVMCTPMPDSC